MNTAAAKTVEAPAPGNAAGMDIDKELADLEKAFGKPAEKAKIQPEKKICPRCEKFLPADLKHFYPDKKSATGLSSWCRECNRQKQRDYDIRRGKVKATEERPGHSATDNDPPAKRPASVQKHTREKPAKARIVLDFSDHPQMLARIKSAAKASWRSVDQQIMAWAETGLVREAEWTLGDDNSVALWAKEETA